jgi:hypothetical protein
MNLFTPKTIFLATCLVAWLNATTPLAAQVLFDNTKAETAGNADWIIDTSQPVPSPAISGITAGTAESYWTGALSSWGLALAKLGNAGTISLPGNGLETLPTSGRITYGDASNSQDLSHYKVYVVCEPNILFTATEKTAILNFVKNGGGLFMVADHTGADRNNDGNDSLTCWNDLLNNNMVQNNPFGFTFNADSGSPPATVDNSVANPMTHGIGGTVTTLKYDVGCTMNLTDNTVAHAAVWQTNPTKVMALYGTFGSGRFCAIGDSSVVEDATSSQGTTYAGWTTPADNGYCVINGMIWLLNAGATTNQLPSVTTSAASNLTTNSATLNGSLNPNGAVTTAKFEYGLTTSYGSTVALAGTFTGSNSVTASTNLAGLVAGTVYHFRLTATNANGLTLGSDQNFTTVSNSPSTNLPPSISTLAASNVTTNTATLNGTLNPNSQPTTAQFEYGLTTSYGSSVALAGTFTGSGSVAVSTNLTGLTPGTTYHFRLNGTNAGGLTLGTDQSFITVSTNSGVVSSNSYSGVLAGWEVTGLSGYGASPYAATTNAPNVTVVGLTRGSGVGTANTAAANTWGGTGFVFTNEAAAIAGNSFASFSLTAGSGYILSCTNIPAHNIRRSSAGATTGSWQYQVGGGTFTDIGSAITWANTTSTGNSQSAIDLSGISALQNVAAGTTVTFRLVLWGGTGTGTWYVNNITGLDLQVLGVLSTTLAANTAPIFTTPSAGTNFNLNAGANLAVSCTATDAEAPAQTLTYTLLTGPTNATVTATNGSFQWRPLVAQANTTNQIRIAVTDNGSPSLSATNFFSVVVNPLSPPSVATAAITGGQFRCVVTGQAGPDYAVQFATNLTSADWTTLFTTNAPALPFTFTDPNALSAQRFYRIVVGP